MNRSAVLDHLRPTLDASLTVKNNFFIRVVYFKTAANYGYKDCQLTRVLLLGVGSPNLYDRIWPGSLLIILIVWNKRVVDFLQ